MQGESYDSQRQGIWLNQEYAHRHHLRVGQSLKVGNNDHSVSLQIKGLVQSPAEIYFTGAREFIAPNYTNYGYGYLSPKTLKNKLGYLGPQNVAEIKGHQRQMRKKIEQIFHGRLISYYNRTTLPEYSTAAERGGEIRRLSYLFSFIFILLAVLAMYTTLRRLIDHQTSQIATFKALGFSNIRIEVHYASFGLLVGGLGTIGGALCAPCISWFVLRSQEQMFSLPHWVTSYLPSSLLMILGVVAICVFAAWYASYNATRGLPATFLRGDKQKKLHHLLLEHWSSLWGTSSGRYSLVTPDCIS